jgi:DNA invertase Pin-like site-specific DNA recombinase
MKEATVGLQVVRNNDSAPRKILAAVYSRISTVGHGQDSTMQTRELIEYCERRGWEIFESYVDEGVSGKKDSRPQLNRLMADAHARRFDVVVVWRFDRFSRSVSHLCRTLETFRALKIDFVSMMEQIDTTTPAGTFVFHVLAAVAQSERETTVERVRAGLRNAKARGKRLGRPTKSVDVARINSLRAAGHSWRTIAGMMKLSVGTVYAAARSQQGKALCA